MSTCSSWALGSAMNLTLGCRWGEDTRLGRTQDTTAGITAQALSKTQSAACLVCLQVAASEPVAASCLLNCGEAQVDLTLRLAALC